MSNAFEARVYRHPDSSFWRARFRVWNAIKQEWTWRTQSTKETDEGRAVAIANEFAELARRTAPGSGRSKLTRDEVLEAVNAILRIAGLPVVRETVGWKSYSDTWLESKRKAQREGANTADSYASQIKTFTVSLEDPETPLNTIDVQHLRKWQTALSAAGRAGKTVNNITKTVGTIFRQAVAEGFMPRNPMDLLAKATETPRERETFSLKEIQTLLDHLQLLDETDWHTAALLGLCTGQRLTDCTGALWTNIDKTAGPWWVWTLTQKKTGTRVEIPLVEPLASHLKTLDTGDSLYLCPSLAFMPSSGNAGLSATFTTFLEGAGIVGLHVPKKGKGRGWNSKTFHSLRHTCNSIMANAGVSQDVRRQILGHASEAMNTRYTHMAIATSGTAMAGSIGVSLSSATKASAPATRGPRRKADTDTAPSSTAKRADRRIG